MKAGTVSVRRRNRRLVAGWKMLLLLRLLRAMMGFKNPSGGLEGERERAADRERLSYKLWVRLREMAGGVALRSSGESGACGGGVGDWSGIMMFVLGECS